MFDTNTYIDGRLLLADDDIVRVNGQRYRFGSVSGYAARYNEQDKATARIDQAIERGHNLVWLNPECVVIAADPSTVDRSFIATLELGDVIYVDSEHADERGFYELTPERNDNIKLVRTDQ